MKKTLMMAVAMTALSMPAMANENDTAMHKSEKVEMKTEAYMAQIDTNNDHMISKSEHDAFGDKMFTEADTNKDAMISVEEMKAAKKKEMEKMETMKRNAGNQ